ncbi:rac GTPase-activating protein 1-like [Limulus polyphemus]|uniref:Rac GTPase-activating protein 1-like n=1 Tax=Limulus polyphemus TaxID=6850 RepID=A0ABM1BEN7_LIMPO|nr:rac GTPase-activating protein 1-like [Limulus polyphemus]
MAPTSQKMSLVAQFDDLCRYSGVLMCGNESEFLAFVRNQNEKRTQNLASVKEIQRLKRDLTKAKEENNTLETKLKHAKSLIDTEMKKRMKAEADRSSLERQIALIRDVLLTDQNVMNDQTREKLAFLNNTSQANARQPQHDSPRRLETIDESLGSLLSPSDISFDKTDDDVDGQVPLSKPRGRRSKGKRKSGPEKEITPPKKQKSGEIGEVFEDQTSLVATTTVTFPANVEFHASSTVETYPKRRSFSDPSSQDSGPKLYPDLRSIHKSEPDEDHYIKDKTETVNHPKPSAPPTEPFTPTCITNTTPVKSTPIRHFSSAGKLNNRAHVFCTKTVIRPETCLPCGKRIRFYKQAMKCQDCRATCHPECKDQVPLPCVPTTHTPTNKGPMGTIADYTPSFPPMVPAVIVHCIKEIETRGLTEVGLYRISGYDKEVKDVKEKFLRGKGVPNISNTDIHVVCGVLKDFLRSLREPLITRTLWKDFTTAGEMTDLQDSFSALYQAVSQLPQPNRDTLAYLIIHLQRISETPEVKMPLSNLAKVFGPTLIGFSSPEPSPGEMFAETKQQHLVMEKLLNIPSDYWETFVNVENDDLYPNVPKTPETKPAPEGSILGPLSSGKRQGSWSKRSGGVLLGKTPLTPRNPSSLRGGNPKTRQPFFASPMLK